MKAPLAALCGLILTTLLTAPVEADPVPYHATYNADYKGLPVSALGIRSLVRLEDGTYQLSSEAKSFFASITETTRFELAESKPVAQRYEYKRRGIGRKKTVDMRFDWSSGTVGDVAAEHPWSLQVEQPTFDKLLYQYQMQADLSRAHAAGEPWPEMSYLVADSGRLRTYDFKVTGEEEIVTPVGRLQTIKAIRVRKDSDRETTFWLSPAHNFMLVRFKQIESDGKGFELMLKEATVDGAPVRGL